MAGIMLSLVGVAPAAAAIPPPPLEAQAVVVRTFVNGVGDGVPYRVGYIGGGSGGAGFGQRKVVAKHKITNDEIVEAVVRSPQKVEQQGNVWVHEKEARLVSLFGDDERLTVRVVINYGSWLGEGRQGVVTAYCVGYNPECPEWVNTAFAVDQESAVPESQNFEGLTAAWAESVATHFDTFAGNGQPLVDNLWVSADLMLHVRYRIGKNLVGGRFRLDLDPTSEAAPTDSATLASLLLHNLHATGEPEWVDRDGFVWWGERPARGWTSVAEDERLLTLR